jgi:pantoate kinase
MITGIFVLVYDVFFVKRDSVFWGSFSFVVTAIVLSGRRKESISTAVSRYPQPLLRKSSIIAFAHESVMFSRDF